jgi:acyl-CoA synthetase (AMP-forming)/AMP-acid ligase II
VRLFVGNGLRADVWRRMLERFGPIDILEFYGATEANVCLANLDGHKIGSVGRPLPGTNDLALADWDVAAGDFARDADGRLIRVEEGMPGVLLARIGEDHPLARFEGYLDDEATERKIVRSAFEPGDAWFHTGDMLRRDAEGDWYFVDRVGDTFRWKGENVSTEQVAAVLHEVEGVERALVYGVELPGHEGRAGMAAVVPDASAGALAPDALYEAVTANLFPAARPLFVRLVEELPTTDSFKFVRHELQRQGADPTEIDDTLWVRDDDAETYAPLDAERYLRGLAGGAP